MILPYFVVQQFEATYALPAALLTTNYCNQKIPIKIKIFVINSIIITSYKMQKKFY